MQLNISARKSELPGRQEGGGGEGAGADRAAAPELMLLHDAAPSTCQPVEVRAGGRERERERERGRESRAHTHVEAAAVINAARL